MIDLITETFNLFDFNNIKDNHTFFKSKSIEDYWLVCEGDPKKFTHEYQAELLKQCQELCKDRALDKNLNLLCLWQIDSINHEVTSQLNSLEEDIYFFKKHVLYFSEQELQGLKGEIQEVPLKKMLSEKPNDPDIYNLYKSNLNNGSWESLLYRICIKLPFVALKSDEGEDIENLHTKLKENLNDNPELKTLNDIVQNLSSKEIENSPESLFELIKSNLEKGDNREL